MRDREARVRRWSTWWSCCADVHERPKTPPALLRLSQARQNVAAIHYETDLVARRAKLAAESLGQR